MPEKQRSSMSPGLCSALLASDPCLDQGVTLGLDVLAAHAREDSREGQLKCLQTNAITVRGPEAAHVSTTGCCLVTAAGDTLLSVPRVFPHLTTPTALQLLIFASSFTNRAMETIYTADAQVLTPVIDTTRTVTRQLGQEPMTRQAHAGWPGHEFKWQSHQKLFPMTKSRDPH